MHKTRHLQARLALRSRLLAYSIAFAWLLIQSTTTAAKAQWLTDGPAHTAFSGVREMSLVPPETVSTTPSPDVPNKLNCSVFYSPLGDALQNMGDGEPVAPAASFAETLSHQSSVGATATSKNLKIYLICGRGEVPNYAPKSLGSALSERTVRVAETGRVNGVQIENHGHRPVFAHAGDLVKGGRQDRMLAFDAIIAPHVTSTVAAFCVEPHRWTGRGSESDSVFSAAGNGFVGRMGAAARLESSQSQVWTTARDVQQTLSASLGTPIYNPVSSTSLELSLEHQAVGAAALRYMPPLEALATKTASSIGYVAFANGNFLAGDVYASHQMFADYWPKLLRARIIDSLIADRAPREPISQSSILALQSHEPKVIAVNASTTQITQSSADLAIFHTIDRDAGGKVVHVSIVRRL